MFERQKTKRLLPMASGAMHTSRGIEYKIGLHGHTYRWSDADQEWHRSERVLVRDRDAWRLQDSTGRRVEQDFAMPTSWLSPR